MSFKERLKPYLPMSWRRAYWRLQFGLRVLHEVNYSSLRGLRSLSRSRLLLHARLQSYISIEGLLALEAMAAKVISEGVPGDIVECGVCNGGSSLVLAQALKASPDRRLWLFDSFQGLPVPTAIDGPTAPAFAGKVVGSEDKVRRLLKRAGVPMERVHIAAGWFHETFPQVQIDGIAFLHIDADFYEPVLLSLERFYDAVAVGGFVVLDDYYDLEWPGCKAALEEFTARRRLALNLLPGPPAHFRKERQVSPAR